MVEGLAIENIPDSSLGDSATAYPPADDECAGDESAGDESAGGESAGHRTDNKSNHFRPWISWIISRLTGGHWCEQEVIDVRCLFDFFTFVAFKEHPAEVRKYVTFVVARARLESALWQRALQQSLRIRLSLMNVPKENLSKAVSLSWNYFSFKTLSKTLELGSSACSATIQDHLQPLCGERSAACSLYNERYIFSARKDGCSLFTQNILREQDWINQY